MQVHHPQNHMRVQPVELQISKKNTNDEPHYVAIMEKRSMEEVQ
jgi:hypothetical protein